MPYSLSSFIEMELAYNIVENMLVWYIYMITNVSSVNII